MSAAPRAPVATITGPPDWLTKAGIEPGEFLIPSKPQLRAWQRPGHMLKVQVWATLMLHAAGYQGELAVIMIKGGRVRNLASMDIVEELFQAAIAHYRGAGITPKPIKKGRTEELETGWEYLRETRQSIRRALEDLEEDGVCERQSRDGTPLRELTEAELRRLPAGSGQLHVWAKPRPTKPENVRAEWEERLNRASEEKANDVAIGWLPTSSIQLILNTVAKTIPGISLFPEKPTRAEIEDPLYQSRFQKAWEIAARSFANAWTDSGHVAAPGLPQNRRAPNAPRLPEVGSPAPPSYKEERQGKDINAAAAFVGEALNTSAAAAHKLLSEARRGNPTVTADEVVALARAKIAENMDPKTGEHSLRNWVGLVLTTIGAMASGPELRKIRKLAQAAQAAVAKEAADVERFNREAQAILDDPTASEDDRKYARQILGIDSKSAGGM